MNACSTLLLFCLSSLHQGYQSYGLRCRPLVGSYCCKNNNKNNMVRLNSRKNACPSGNLPLAMIPNMNEGIATAATAPRLPSTGCIARPLHQGAMQRPQRASCTGRICPQSDSKLVDGVHLNASMRQWAAGRNSQMLPYRTFKPSHHTSMDCHAKTPD